MSISIRSRLLLLVLSVLAPGVVAALLLIAHTYTVEREALQRNLRETTRALSLVVDSELSRRATIASVLALSRALDNAPDLSDEQLAVFERQARQGLRDMGGWVELRSRDRTLLSTRPVQHPTATAAAPQDAAPPQPFAEAPTILGLPPGKPGPASHASLLEPVLRDGRAVLNVAVILEPAALQRIIDGQRLPEGWVATVIDRQGTVVARQPGGAAYAGRTATPDLRQHLGARSEGPFQAVTLDGQEATGYFSTSPRGWTYLTALPRAELGGWLPSAVVQLTLAALLLLGLAVAGALWVSRRIVGPVVSLKQAAERMQAGQPVAQQRTGIRECDEVAAALAQAASVIQQAHAEQERRVADAVSRTRVAEQLLSQHQRVEALGRLTGGVAHDFNNLLGVISNSAHLIRRRGPGADLQAPVAAVLRAVEVGSRLTQHLLRFAGRHPAQMTRVDLASTLPATQELLAVVLGKRIEVAVEVAPDTRSIHVDAGELELALINLALNARDALPAGGHVWLQARNATAEDAAGMAPGPCVQISFSDDGAGVDESIADRVFDPFFTTKSVGQGAGLGLGLSQVHGFCKQAGGRARLNSTPGLGTTVLLLLPAADAGGSGLDAGGSAAALAAPGHALAGKRVLLVEDNDELGDATDALLRSYGSHVERARSAAEGLRQVADRGPFSAVLSDVVMPGEMDGLAMARTLRESHPALPVVLISGYSSALDGVHGFAVLHKPCTPEDLVAALQRAMAGTPSAMTQERPQP